MGRLDRLPYHGRTHLPGGTDPIPGLSLGGGGTELGPWHQSIPLTQYGSGGGGLDVSGFAWVPDASFAHGGYIGATADTSYFTSLIQLAPKGAIFQLSIRMATGPDFGRVSFALTSLEYESASRPSGDTTGKIAPVDGAYGTFSYIDMIPAASTFNFEGYSASATGDFTFTGTIPFIMGGDVGDPLTDFETAVSDPLTGFKLTDGGPGWYRIKCYVDGKNASSSGYKTRISEILLTRRADDNAP